MAAKPAPQLGRDSAAAPDRRSIVAGVLRWLWVGAILTGSVLFVGSHRSEVVDAASAVPSLRLGPATCGVLLSFTAMLNRAAKSRASHRAVGLGVPRWSMVRPTMVGFSADKAVRMSGLAVMLQHGARMGYSTGSVLASTVVAKAANLISLIVFFVLAVGSLWLKGELVGWWLAVGTGLAIYLVIGGVAVAAIARSGRRSPRWWSWVERRSPFPLRDQFGRHPIETIASGVRTAGARRARTVQVVAHAVGAKTLGTSLLVAASHAAGAPLGPGDALVVYATVLLASMASLTPGGVGAVEASAVTVMVGAGVVVSEAVLVVTVFRVFDLWLPLVVGGGAAAWSRSHGRRTPLDDDRGRVGDAQPVPGGDAVGPNYCS